ncbi:hypothetical protein PBI_GAIA_42 [Mycobacterium phage Gaia]|uniref:Uncharacterized protein n=1 Tax=Mycobacterium phage Gaia TaxID=1486472 RepID=A0A068F1P0_9CAUD|nr:hypothetical protein VC46_gp042 [Mycobacterium phage Gaia]AID58862.1 hypothetical protein PBI_GAIA_42 [Mycobacterium phage Gaia]AYQ99983.1 hypothetical protein PBI_NEBKISS_42 [Mycobacterium phage Nebkiss]
MSINKFVRHRMGFPIMRKIAMAGAVVVNAATAAYIQTQTVVEAIEDDYISPGLYI